MFQKFNPWRSFVICSVLSLLAVAGYANNREVIDFVGSSTVVAGQNYNGQVSTNESGISVTFTSDPPGLVNYTTIVPGTEDSVSIPTNPNATGTSYRIVAAPSSGGVSKSVDKVAVFPVQ